MAPRFALLLCGILLGIGLWVGIGIKTPVTADGSTITYLPLLQGRPSVLANYRLLMLSNRNGTTQIYTMNAAGHNLFRLSDLPAKEPLWSPDGSHVLFASPTDEGDNLYVVKSDGSDLRALTTMPGDEYEALWSPTGDAILFLHDQANNALVELYTLALDADATPTLIAENPSLRTVRWSPSGALIGYGADGAPADTNTLLYQVFVYDRATGETVQITTGDETYEFLGWMQNGKRLLIASDYADDRRDLYTIQPDGTHFQQLTTSMGLEMVHAISPDGEEVAYSHKLLDSMGAQLFDQTLGNDSPTLLSETFCNTATCGLENVAFSPNGEQLLYVTLEANSGIFSPSNLWIVQTPQVAAEWSLALSDVYGPLWVDNDTLIVHRKGEALSAFSRVPYIYNIESGIETPLLPHDTNRTMVYDVRFLP